MSLISISELINEWKNKKVTIPLLQRNYKWNSGDANEPKKLKNTAVHLLYDILEKFSKKECHIIGLVTAYIDTNGNVSVIDGQQRFITLTLIAKALEMQNENCWIKLDFERDTQEKERYNFIYSDNIGVPKSVDVRRMNDNLNEISKLLCLPRFEDIDRKELFEFILKNVKLVYRETKREPLEEFLNMNFNKTPFCASDYVKAYMLMDTDKQDESQKIARDDILCLWRSIQKKLFSLDKRYCSEESNLENEMYRLICKNYKHCNVNRTEVLFEDDYYENNELCNYKYNEKTDALKNEFDWLKRCDRTMYELLGGLGIMINKDIHRPNYTLFNAFWFLCSRNKDAHFFKLLKDTNKSDNILNTLQCKYSSYGSYGKNDFAETLMAPYSYSRGTSKKLSSYADDNDYALFLNIFNEYTDIITKVIPACDSVSEEPDLDKAVKEKHVTSTEASDCKFCNSDIHNIEQLFSDSRINKVIIPCIQRDYVMGNYARDGYNYSDYIEAFLSKIRYLELRTHFCQSNEKDINENVKWKKLPSVNIDVNLKEELIKRFFPLDREIDKNLFDKNSYHNIWYELNRVNYNVDENGENEMTGFLGINNLKLCYNNTKIDKRGAGFVKYENTYKCVTETIKSIIKNTFEEKIDYNSKVISDMNFSCLTGYLDNNKNFWIYDGQQRLSTIIVMLTASLFREYDERIANFIRKFRFDGRNNANTMLETAIKAAKNKTIDTSSLMKELRTLISDQTCFSIYVLLDRLTKKTDGKWEEFQKISCDYLLKALRFELVVTEETDDSEQLFIELNEGEKLMYCEEYKAKLSSELGKICPDKRNDIMRKIDNKWLDSFENEDDEFACIQYCITYAHHELIGYDKDRENSDISGLNINIIDLAVDIIDKLSEDKCKVNFDSIKDGILLWISKLEFTDKTYCYDDKIYFAREEFKNFIDKLCNKELYIDAFMVIYTQRKCSFVSVLPDSVETDSKNNNDETYLNQLLLHRRNRYRAGIYCGDNWKDESKAPFDVSCEKSGRESFEIPNYSNDCIRAIDEILANYYHDDIFDTLFYSGKEQISAVRTISTEYYIRLFNKYDRNLLKKSEFSYIDMNSTFLVETAYRTIDDIDTIACYRPYLIKFAIKKGVYFGKTESFGDPFDGINKHLCCMNNYKNNGCFPEIEKLDSLRTLIKECDKIVYDDVMKYASKYAVYIAIKDKDEVYMKDKNDNNYRNFQWLRYTVQEYLKAQETEPCENSFTYQLISESTKEAQNSGVLDMGFDFRSLFPPKTYLKFCSDAKDSDERKRYIGECGFGKDNISDDDVASLYDKYFILPNKVNKLFTESNS